MTFKEYAEKAITTRVYSPKVALPYVVLGLCGETGEFFEKLAEEKVDSELAKKEIGDVLWYCAAICVELKLPMLDWPITTPLAQIEGLLITANMGAVAEQMKKYLRDDWKEDEEVDLPEERKEKIRTALEYLLSSFQAMAVTCFNEDLSSIAAANIEKLAKRKENGMLHGSGDTRGE